MAIYKNVVDELKDYNGIRELYRFQGANSFEHFDFRTSRFNKDSKGYVYFSESLEHHKYFTNKRIRQMLNRIVLKDTPYQICCYDLRDNKDNCSKIKNIIINSDKLSEMYSIRLVCNPMISELISSNYQYQSNKDQPRVIERVDRRVHGGGYGITDEWKDLLTYLTYFNAYKEIDRKAILQLITNIGKDGRVNNRENISFLLDNTSGYKIKPTPAFISDFTKYQIRDCLESIIEKELCLPDSSLAVDSNDTIKEVINSYEQGKKKTLSLLDKYL